MVAVANLTVMAAVRDAAAALFWLDAALDA